MSNSIGTVPALMVTRIAQSEGASLATQKAKVAQLRMEMANAQAEKQAQSNPAEQALSNPVNGAEVNLLI